MTAKKTTKKLVKEAEALSRAIRPLLAGKGPDVQSAALADLVSLYLAGVAPPLRPELREMFIALVDQLVPESEAEMFGDEGHPFMREQEHPGDEK